MGKDEENTMSRRGHRDIFAKDIEWKKGSSDGIDCTTYLMDEDDTNSPLIVLSRFKPAAITNHGAMPPNRVLSRAHWPAFCGVNDP